MAIGTVGLTTHIWNNNFRSLLLLGVYPVLLCGIFWVLCAVTQLFMTVQATPQTSAWGSVINVANEAFFTYWPFVVAGTGLWFCVALLFHGRMIRTLSRSHPVTRTEEPALYNLVENLCISQGVETPKIEIIETHAKNAFASGIDRKSYTITVTRGLMNSLSRDELEGVLAHELTHILNRDVRLLIISVIFTGMLGFAAQAAWSILRRNLFYTGRRNGKNGGGIFILIAVIAAVLWIGYLATLLTRFAISRRREFMADAGAVAMTKNPDAMMRALLRIARRDHIPEATDDIALMCVHNSKPFLGFFMTHPPIDARINALSQATGTPVPDIRLGARAEDGARFGAAAQQDGMRPSPWLTRQRPGR